jgi:hypothetical protein
VVFGGFDFGLKMGVVVEKTTKKSKKRRKNK